MKGYFKYKFLKDSFWSSGATILLSLSGLFVTIYAGNVYGASVFGEFSIALSFFSVSSILFTLGINQSIFYELAYNDTNKERMSIYFFNTIYLALLSSFICVLFLYLISLISIQLYDSENVTYFIRILSFSVPFFIINKVCVMVLNAQRKFNYLFICNTVRVLVLIFSILFLEKYYGLKVLAISIIFSECALLLLFFFLLKKHFELKKPNLLVQKNILFFGEWRSSS